MLEKSGPALAQVENMEWLTRMNKSEGTCLGWDKTFKRETRETVDWGRNGKSQFECVSLRLCPVCSMIVKAHLDVA